MPYIFRYISDRSQHNDVTICGSGEREQQIYSSEGHSVDVQIITEDHQPGDNKIKRDNFMLEYQGELYTNQ